MQTDRLKVEHRTTWYVLPLYADGVLLCNTSVSARMNSFKQPIYDQLQSPDRFFVFKFQEYNSDGRRLPSLQNQMIRKGLNYSDNFSLLDFSEFTSYRVNHTLALLKSKIPIDLSQPVTLLSLSHEEMLRKEVKNTHKYISSEIFMEK